MASVCSSNNYNPRMSLTGKETILVSSTTMMILLFSFLLHSLPICSVASFLSSSSSETLSRHRCLSRTALQVAVDPLRSFPSSFENNNSNNNRKNPRKQQQHQIKAKFGSKGGKKNNKDTKDPAVVEAAVQVALEALVLNAKSLDVTSSSSSSTVLLFPTVRECNAALAAFGDAGDLLRALRLFGKMRKAAYLQESIKRKSSSTTSSGMRLEWPVPVPTLVTYSTLMSRAVSASKPHVALRLWNNLMPSSIEPDVKAVNILMNCYAKLGNVPMAKRVLYEMENDGLEPNIVTFNTVLNACQKACDLDTALEIKAEMDHYFDIQPDARTYTTLMATVARRTSKSSGQKDPTVALMLLQEMHQRGVSPNGMTYSAFIEACGRCGRIDLALQALRLMQRQKESEKERLQVDHHVLDNEVGAWTSAIHVCGKMGRWETAIRLFRSMKKLGCPPNTVTCGCLTDLLLRAGRTAETLGVLRYMKKEGIVPSEVMYTSLMTRADRLVQMENSLPLSDEDAVAEETETKAIEVYTELMMSLMETTGTKAKNVHRRGSTTAENDMDALLLKVFLVFQQMKAAGAEPDLACFNVLLRACARAGDVARGMNVLRQIQASPNFEPNDGSWRELLRAAATARQAEIAETIWNQGLSYHRHSGRLVDEPERRWVPSLASLKCLLTAYLREAAATTDATRRRELYERVLQTYEDVLMGERRMGLQRIDPMEMLDDAQTISLVLQALVALRPLTPNGDRRMELLATGHSLLKLECIQPSTSLGWPARKAIEVLQNWDLAP